MGNLGADLGKEKLICREVLNKNREKAISRQKFLQKIKPQKNTLFT